MNMTMTIEMPKRGDGLAVPVGVACAGFAPVELPVLVGDREGRAVRALALVSKEEIRFVVWRQDGRCETLCCLFRCPDWGADADMDFWAASFVESGGDWMEAMDLDWSGADPRRLLAECLQKACEERGWTVAVLA